MHNTKKTSLKPFTGHILDDHLSEISANSSAIYALGALLETADLGEKFGNDWPDYLNNRYGLNKIIELCLEKQEQQLDNIRNLYNESPEGVILYANRDLNMIQSGGYRTSEAALETINKQIEKLQAVVTAFDYDYPKAKQLLNDFRKIRSQYTESTENKTQSIKKVG